MANKKINQLVSKTAILSTDLFGIGDATTGQLFKKTIAELQAAIGGAVISVNGLVGTVVLDTDDIQELATPTNKYFTDARARAAISLTVTGNSGASTYSSGTGVLNVPTYTLAGLGGITASFLSGTSGISYNSSTGVISYSGTVYTDSSIRALLSGGTGITYNSSTGAISYSGTVYTDSSVRALISLTTTGTSGASTYNNTTGVINVPEYTLAGLGGISLTSLSGGTGITYNSSTGAISYSGTVYTDASVRALISATSPISYNNTTGVISITQSSTSVSGFLSSTDWNTFNNKQSTITLTTTGTSGNATFSSNTLNIPNYGSALSGTTNYVSKFTSSTSIGNSLIFDNGTNVGIGATTLRAKLDVSDGTVNTSGEAIYQGLFTGATRPSTTDLTAILTIQSNDAMAADKGGSIAFGGRAVSASSAGANWAGISGLKENGTSANYNGYLSFWTRGGSPTEKMRIASDGVVTIKGGKQLSIDSGTTGDAGLFIKSEGTNTTGFTNIQGFHGGVGYNSSIVMQRYGGNILMGTTSNNGERLYVSGDIRATGSITANSDISLKKNFLKIENALEKIEQINGYTYELKADDSKRHAGVIAQEIQTVLPEIVNTGNDGLMGVEYGNISALLIEAIKEQNTKIKNLETLLACK